jgi:hypothetical protein
MIPRLLFGKTFRVILGNEAAKAVQNSESVCDGIVERGRRGQSGWLSCRSAKEEYNWRKKWAEDMIRTCFEFIGTRKRPWFPAVRLFCPFAL